MVFRSLLLLVLVLALAVAQGEESCSGELRCDTQPRGRPCGRAEKTLFNENLLDLFRAEYGKESNGDTDIYKILNWKFESLDRNDDNILQRSEYKPLKRLKRLIKPKKCAKVFAKACDKDKDFQISKSEWNSCLGMNLVSLRSSSVVTLSERKRKDEPEANDCISDRQTVLAEQRAHELYVPECGADGRYRRVQCYKSTGYCWCVHEDDGKPIPGTSVKDQPPDCDSVPAPQRPMKGCPAPMKEKFLEDLFELFLNDTHGEDVVATTFSKFDKDGSKYLERKEWKAFRSLVAPHKALRRCGKRLPKFCDVNNDRRISLTEWGSCLDEPQGGEQKRRGPNPLQTILKDD